MNTEDDTNPKSSASSRPPALDALEALLLASGAEPDSLRSNEARDKVPVVGGAADLLDRLTVMVDPIQRSPKIQDGDLLRATALIREGVPLLLLLEADEDATGDNCSALLLRDQVGEELHGTLYSLGQSPRELAGNPAWFCQELGFSVADSLRWLALEMPTVEPSPVVTTTPFARLKRLLRPDRGDILAVCLFAIAMGVLLLATPVAVQALVNFVALGGAFPPLIVVASLLFVGLALAGILAGFQTWVVEILQRRLFARTVADLAARLPRVAIETYDKRYGPEIVNRFFDIATMQKTASTLLLDGLNIVLTIVVGLILLAFYHPLLLAFDILLLASIALILFGPLRNGVRSAIAESKAKYEVAEWLEEITRNPMVYRSGGVAPWVYSNSDRVVGKYLDRRGEHYKVLFKQIISVLSLHVLANTALLTIGGFLVITGELTLGQLVAAEIVVTMVVASVAKMGKQLENFYDLMAASDKVGHLLDLPLETMGGEHPLPPAEPRGAELELCSVAGGRPGAEPLFKNISIKLAPGERLGICGPSGAGKHALVDLLWGLRAPRQGTIRIDGRDIKSLSLDSLRSTASLLAEVEIVGGTVRDNVKLGRPSLTDDLIRVALDQVGILDDVEQLPEGLDTELNARGWPLTVGQVRCLQAARVIASKPRIIIVADPFLPLGGVVRKDVVDVLTDPASPWTLILATESEDVLEHCDRVLELPGGVIRDSSDNLRQPQV